MRLVTWNLLCESQEYAAQRTEAAVAALTPLRPDIVCFQEVRFDANGRSNADILADALGLQVATRSASRSYPDGSATGLAVLTRWGCADVRSEQVFHPKSVPLADGISQYDEAVVFAAVQLADSGKWGNLAGSWVVTTHLSWGLGCEGRRVRECVALETFAALLAGEPVGAANPGGAGTAVILAGDLNATDDGPALGFLTGRHVVNGASTYWVDAWERVGVGPGYTSVPTDMWSARLASRLGFTPDMMPSRRIDYVLSRGWRAGRPGTPVAAQVLDSEDGLAASDHRCLVVDLSA